MVTTKFSGIEYSCINRSGSFGQLKGYYYYIPGKHRPTNAAVYRNIPRIKDALKTGRFVDLHKDLIEITRESLLYNAPRLILDSPLSASTFYEKLWSYVEPSPRDLDYGAFILFGSHDCNEGNIVVIELTTDNPDVWFEGLKNVGQGYWYNPGNGEKTLYSSIDIDWEEKHGFSADDLFDYEARKLSEEIKERVNKLRLKGIDERAIYALFAPECEESRLIITKDYRIILPDFNNMEIKMEPLPKAVFLLFLKHPEGIYFKQLRNYTSELFDIYKAMTNTVDISNVITRLERITDPFDNSINEKCSRIREAFLSQMSEDIAENYFITGRRGCEKKIKLKRNLINIQCVF